ncbi:MAG TPA: peroxiredoxin [Acidimicrobiales bacterium]|nr:peroxiredoxin [Acidimicrobiales bacterium]
MPIAEGERIPDVELKRMGKREPEKVRSLDVLGKGRVVLFGVPGAFTPTCSDHHLPGFLVRADELKEKGVDRIACVSVNDAWVMGAWGEARGVGDQIEMLADGNGEFTRALGLEKDLSASGLGLRSARFAMVLDDGIVTYLGVESAPGVSVSGAGAVLAAL